MTEFSDMFTGSIESLDERTDRAREQLDRVINNKDIPTDAVTLMNELTFINRFQQLLFKRLLIELDNMAADIKNLQSKK